MPLGSTPRYYSDETLIEFTDNISSYKDTIFTICFNIKSVNDGGSINIKLNNYYDQPSSCMLNYVSIDTITACNCISINDVIIDNKSTLNMIYTAITYIKDICPWLTKINLCDYRKSICRKGEATPGMLLSCYYIALTGKNVEFFSKLKQQIPDMNELCKTIQPWLEMFMKLFIFETNLNLLNNIWVFNISDIQRINYYMCDNTNIECVNKGYVIL